jgi:hypothetical protein
MYRQNKYEKTHINETIKNTVQTTQNTVFTSTFITKTPTPLSSHDTYSDPQIIKKVQTATVQDTQDITLIHLTVRLELYGYELISIQISTSLQFYLCYKSGRVSYTVLSDVM